MTARAGSRSGSRSARIKTVTFAAGETSKAFTMLVFEDPDDEGSVTLSNPSGAHIVEGSARGPSSTPITRTGKYPEDPYARG